MVDVHVQERHREHGQTGYGAESLARPLSAQTRVVYIGTIQLRFEWRPIRRRNAARRTRAVF